MGARNCGRPASHIAVPETKRLAASWPGSAGRSYDEPPDRTCTLCRQVSVWHHRKRRAGKYEQDVCMRQLIATQPNHREAPANGRPRARTVSIAPNTLRDARVHTAYRDRTRPREHVICFQSARHLASGPSPRGNSPCGIRQHLLGSMRGCSTRDAAPRRARRSVFFGRVSADCSKSGHARCVQLRKT